MSHSAAAEGLRAAGWEQAQHSLLQHGKGMLAEGWEHHPGLHTKGRSHSEHQLGTLRAGGTGQEEQRTRCLLLSAQLLTASHQWTVGRRQETQLCISKGTEIHTVPHNKKNEAAEMAAGVMCEAEGGKTAGYALTGHRREMFQGWVWVLR